MKVSVSLITCLLLIGFVLGLNIGENCFTPSGGRGKCMLLEKCSNYFSILNNTIKPIPHGFLNYLKRSNCRTLEKEESVCCPDSQILTAEIEERKGKDIVKPTCTEIFKNEEVERLVASKNEEIASKDKEIQRLLLLLSKGYMLIPELGYYAYHDRGVNFTTASDECENEGAHLVIINSFKEEDELRKLMNRNGNHAVWTGIIKEDKEFQTIFGTPLEKTGYSKWQTGEPNNNNGNENCVDFEYNHGGLNDLGCEFSRPFICEIEI